MIIVPPRGPIRSKFYICGEGPGRSEAQALKPFVGASGREQDSLLVRGGVDPKIFRYNNVIQEYTPGNPDPTYQQIIYWTPKLIADIATCNPSIILAVGAFACRWFLGESADLETCHGMPFRCGAFDSSIADRCPSHTIIIPVYHPAFGMHSDDDGNGSGKSHTNRTGSEARSLIAWDYSRACSFVKDIQRGKSIEIREDEYLGREVYSDVTGTELQYYLESDYLDFEEPLDVIGLDTEGDPDWSIQVSTRPGNGYTLRRSQPDFEIGAAAIQELVDSGCLIVLHQAQTPQGCCYDMTACLAMGVNLRRARIFDTMYAAYLLRIEAKALKALGIRWCGMSMSPYMEVIGDSIGKQKQIAYLKQVAALTADWPKPETQIVREPDGICAKYSPRSLHKSVLAILKDIAADKRGKDGKPVNIHKRWHDIDLALRRPAMKVLGKLPYGNLEDIPLSEAIEYASKDPDCTLRLYYQLSSELERMGLTAKMDLGMSILPILWEMQTNGMPASKSKFLALHAEMLEEMAEIQDHMSEVYFSGRPFNPNSRPQTETLLRRRGLTSAAYTPSGDISTSADAISHLRFEDPAIEELFLYREKSNLASSHCNSVVERLDADADSPEDEDLITVYGNLKPATTASSRLSSEKFKDEFIPSANLLATPAHSNAGKRLRSCYEFPESADEVFGAWDLSGIEMRFVAHESADPIMCDSFIRALDIHRQTASLIFKVPYEDISKSDPRRQAAKTVGFLVLYGGGPEGLLTQLRMQGLTDWDKSGCKRLIAQWFEVYSGIARCIKETGDQAREAGGVVRDWMGMIRYLPGLFSDDFQLRSESEREAFSLRIQGGAQEMIQNSMRWLDSKILMLRSMGYRICWRLQIHDEIVLSFQPDLWELVNELVLEALTEHSGIKLRIPVLANGSFHRSWGGVKG